MFSKKLFLLANVLCMLAAKPMMASRLLPPDSLINCNTDGCNCDRVDGTAPVGVMVDHLHPKGEWMVQYRYMQMLASGTKMDGNTISTDKVLVDYVMATKSMSMQMQMLMLMYGITERVTIMGMVNFNNSTMTMQMPTNAMPSQSGNMIHNHCNCTGNVMTETMKTIGLGDTKVYALANLAEWENASLVGSLGLSIPTGSITATGSSEMMGNFRQGYNMQLGSGTLDWIPTLSYRYQQRNTTYGTQLSGTIRSSNNRANYSLGNVYSATQWMTIGLNSWLAISLRAEAIWQNRISGRDSEIDKFINNDANADANNSGGTLCNGLAGLSFRIPKGVLQGQRLAVEYGVPFYNRVNGIQAAQSGILNAAVQIKF